MENGKWFKKFKVQGFNCLRRLRFKGSIACGAQGLKVQEFNCLRRSRFKRSKN